MSSSESPLIRVRNSDRDAIFSASEEVGELSCLSFEMATSLLRRGEDMEKKAAEFVLCGLITMLNVS